PVRTVRDQRPEFTIGPLKSVRVPRKAPVAGSYALILPSPKLPTNRSLLKLPKLAGASTTPQGEFRWDSPAATNYLMKLPFASKMATAPAPVFKFAYST